MLAWGEPYDSPLWSDREDGFAYVCRDYGCQAPQDTLEGLAELITGRKVTITRTAAPTGQPPDAVSGNGNGNGNGATSDRDG